MYVVAGFHRVIVSMKALRAENSFPPDSSDDEEDVSGIVINYQFSLSDLYLQ